MCIGGAHNEKTFQLLFLKTLSFSSSNKKCCVVVTLKSITETDKTTLSMINVTPILLCWFATNSEKVNE